MGTLGYHEREGWRLPAGLAPMRHQGDARLRLNSDLARLGVFLAIDRATERGEFRFFFAGNDVERGVPPEGHRDSPRFWRYPSASRALTGASLDRALSEDGRWRLRLEAATDFADQQIRVYSDSTFTGPPLETGAKHEVDEDRAFHGRALLSGELGALRIAFDARLRDAEHRESLHVGEAEQRYRQRLASGAAELDLGLAAGWRLRGGLSLHRVTTPASGPHPARPADSVTDWLMTLRRGATKGSPLELRAALSRRSRFPALRELYSGALGQFVVNPDLAPETQDLFELGLGQRVRRLSVDITLFASYLEGGIEKTAVSDSTFQRVNAESMRAMGVELEVAMELGGGLELGGHWLQLRASREEAGAYNAPAEDRPDHQGSLFLSWERGGLRLGGEAEWIGPRHSADVTAADGLRELPGQSRVNLTAAWWIYLKAGVLRDAELRLRADNLGDALVESQVGLPEPGRRLSLGLRLGLDL